MISHACALSQMKFTLTSLGCSSFVRLVCCVLVTTQFQFDQMNGQHGEIGSVGGRVLSSPFSFGNLDECCRQQRQMNASICSHDNVTAERSTCLGQCDHLTALFADLRGLNKYLRLLGHSTHRVTKQQLRDDDNCSNLSLSFSSLQFLVQVHSEVGRATQSVCFMFLFTQQRIFPRKRGASCSVKQLMNLLNVRALSFVSRQSECRPLASRATCCVARSRLTGAIHQVELEQFHQFGVVLVVEFN